METTEPRPAGLRTASLSFVEVLATSIALIGPSMTPLLVAPGMYAQAGNGTWLAYVFGGTMLIFVAFCINQFARRTSAAGSMYHYIAEHLGKAIGAIGGWTLLWAYGFVASAVLGAMAVFAGQLVPSWHLPTIVVACFFAFVAWQAAYRGVQVSAIVMLVLEAISVTIICLLIAIVLHAHGASLDADQVKLAHAFPGGLRNVGLAIGFAVFSYVGFESATAFGAEAKRPLITIPRAVVGSVLFATAFFVLSTYAEIVGFAHAGKPLDQETFPIGTLVDAYGIGYLRIPITIGALCSAFSVCLACITTAGRIAFAMAKSGVLPAVFGRVEPKHDTPNIAVTVVTAITLAVTAGAMAGGVAPIDVFNNCGTLSSFGFVLAYILIAVAAAVYSKRLGALRAVDLAVSTLALAFLVIAAIALYLSVPAPPQHWFGYYFLAFLVAGCLWFAVGSARRVQRAADDDQAAGNGERKENDEDPYA